MRSRASQARALFRIVSAQSSSSTTTTAAAQPSRSANRRRRNVAGSLNSTSTTNGEHRTIFINASPSKGNPVSKGHSLISGLQPVSPPVSSLSGVATETFFALNRPLLEHQVVSSSSGSGQGMDAEERKTLSTIHSTIENAKEALMEAASRASRLSADQLSKTTFVISGSLNSKEDADSEVSWPKKVATLEYSRFVRLVDNLSKQGSGVKGVQAEAQALAEDESNRKDVESAVANALERGEDSTVAERLGSEADLVILGEPSGPNPKWPRGVATFLAEKTRALEPPAAPSKIVAGVQDLEKEMERMGIEDLARYFAGSGSAFTMQNSGEDDPNLMLNHAIVQASLPGQLKWDSIVAKMDAAAGIQGTLAKEAVDVSALNADLLADEEANDDNEVLLDSVRRKRKKKMRKHKYRKFRKATRVERNRLKK